MQTEIYTLPELNFVGGKTQELVFNLKDKDGNPYNASGCKTDFSICNYSNKTNTPILSITPEIIVDENNILSRLRVVIPANDTLFFYGKYIYQIIIKDISGRIEIPNQGIMNVTRNIHTDFVQ